MGDTKDRLLYGRSEFARGLGLHKGTITRAINEDRLIVDRETDKIDPQYPTNLAYIQKVVTGRHGTGLTEQFKKELQSNFIDIEKRRRRGKIASVGVNSKAATAYRNIADRLDENIDIETPEGEDLFDKLMSQGLLQPGEQLKIAQTTLANLRIAKEMDDLIVRTMVTRCFARLSGIISSRMLCLGQRSAKPLCSLFGDMSPEKEIAVQKLMDDEIAGAVEAIQREIEDATDW